jgi:pyruvate dehydrogenase E1 component beta subunit
MAIKTYLDALREAQIEEMARDPAVFVMGQDIASNIFGGATGMVEAFGIERVRDTPIAEAGMTGVGIGAAMVGMRPILNYGMATFMFPAVDQIFSMAAKSRYLYGGQARVPMVLRGGMIYGAGNAAQHSDRPYSMYMTMPGLKIIVPSTAYDAKGLMKTAIRDDDPVLCFEDSSLWTSRSDIPDEEYLIPFGLADIKREGSDCTVVAIGAMVAVALKAAEQAAAQGRSLEVVDPRTLAPLDIGRILESVEKTGRLVVVDSAHERCSAASEIAASVAGDGFWTLRAPIARVTTPMTHVPFSAALEEGLYPTVEKILAAVEGTFA